MPCRFFARPLEMLQIYRFAGGLFAVLAVWIAALRSDLQPSRHIAVLLVSSRFRGLPYSTPNRLPSRTACFPLTLLVALLSFDLLCYFAVRSQAPVLLVALFGLYSVTSLIYGVITFRTVPEEATALRQVELIPHFAPRSSVSYSGADRLHLAGHSRSQEKPASSQHLVTVSWDHQ